MKEQLKAEAYVREQRPQASNVEAKAFATKKSCVSVLDHDPSWCGDCYACSICGLKFVPVTSPHRQTKLTLQDWIAVLGEVSSDIYSDGKILKVMCHDNVRLERVRVKFNLTTGQPKTEADYKAFNDIVSV